MKYRIIDEQLSRIATLVESWKSGNTVSAIERDIALSILRSLYDNIGNINAEQHCDSGNTRPDKAVVVEAEYQEKTKAERDVEAETDSDASFDDALDIDALLGLSAPIGDVADKAEEETAAEAERVEEAVKEAEEVTEEAIEEGAASGSSESTQISKIGGLFDIDDIPVRSRSSRKMISLYNTPAQQPKAEPQHNTPKPESTPAAEIKEVVDREVKIDATPTVVEHHKATEPSADESAQKSIAEVVGAASEDKRLGEVLGGGITTLADKMASEEQPTTPFNRISDLHKAIGLNDKFLMIRDLFEGDAERYNDTIDTLNEFDDLDECMIYIVENFAWNPDSEGAKLLVSLIERKLS
ncbi:MAG: hypothetical protein IKA81_05200 [Alistipes sp.]|nr:hypothetical protein [Alistipes sp.]